MHLTAEQIQQLLDLFFPRHLVDFSVHDFRSDRQPDDRVLIVLELALWENPDVITRIPLSMKLATAEALYDLLGQAIDQVGGHYI